MRESARYILPILVFVAAILTIGTVGYLVIEDDISTADAFYTTVTAITPAQFDEVHQLSVPGRYFTVLLVFCGFGAVVAFASQFARLIIQSELEGVGIITRKQMRRRIRRMKNHYIVCGYGEIGDAICWELKRQGFPFVVITDDEKSASSIARAGYAIVNSNPTADASLKEAGIESATGVIALLPDDADNLFIALAARELHPKILIIARGEDSSLEDRILRAGADIVVSPMKLGGRQIAELIKQQSGAYSTTDRTVSSASVLGLRLTHHRHDDPQPTNTASIMTDHDAVGVAEIRRHGGEVEYCPTDAVVESGDELVLITKVQDRDGSIQQKTSGKRILLADDHRALRLLFSRKLTSAGHEVIQASTGDDAIRFAQANPPSLFVLDVNMPGKDGYEVCRALRNSHQFHRVPIILYSGLESDDLFVHGQQAGATRCIRKTSKSSDLLEQIEDVFAEIEQPSSSKFTSPVPTSVEFDIDVALQNAGGDQQLLGELLSVVVEETPQWMSRIRDAMEPLDHNALVAAAHGLKGSLAVIGATGATEAAAKLEQIEPDQPGQELKTLYDELESRVNRLMKQLQGRLHRERATGT